MLATLKSKIADPAYAEVHGCAGHNTCKGLGGCKVDAATLKVLAEKAGIPLSEAGEPHGCAGKNECKGLGGCSVDAAKLKKLKAKH
jgi:citrate lyase alpha subunit